MKLTLTFMGICALACAFLLFREAPPRAVSGQEEAVRKVPRLPTAATPPSVPGPRAGAPPETIQRFTDDERKAAREGFKTMRAQRRKKLAAWRERLGPYIASRPVMISGAELLPLKGVRAFPLSGNGSSANEVARIPGYSLREDETSSEGLLAFYDAEREMVLVASGSLTLKVDDVARRRGIEEGLGLAVTGEEPRLKLLFLQTGAKSLEQLAAYLAAAKGLPGVRDARLDLIGPRVVPQ